MKISYIYISSVRRQTGIEQGTMESLDHAQAIENRLVDNFANGLSESTMWLRRESARQWLSQQSDLQLTPAAIDRLSAMSIPDSERRIAWIEASHMDSIQHTPSVRPLIEEPTNIYRAAFDFKAREEEK